MTSRAMEATWRRWLRRAGLVPAVSTSLAALVFSAFLALDLAFPFPRHLLDRPLSVEVTDRSGTPLRLFLAADERWRLPVRLEELPEELVAAVIASEDRRFGRHPGVDPLAVVRAAWTNLRSGRVVSGGSTLPMQVARMAEPRPRTLGAKVVEAFRALQLAWHLEEGELLELYLSLAPYGANLEGVTAGARLWFGKHPRQLSLGEIALLVTLPRSPNAYDPARHPEAARRARDRVLEQLVAAGVASPERARQARAQPLPAGLQPVPFEAPHLARHAVSLARRRGRVSGPVATTLDLRVQRTAEAQVARHIGELRQRGIGNVAVVVLENAGVGGNVPLRQDAAGRTAELWQAGEAGAVRAWVGSAGFGEAAHQGQVDGVLARRSPGSALKPFLYGLAFDAGAVIPDSWLLDVPRDWAGYVPENYDGTYAGRVTARQALTRSLNAPAVALLARTGLERFHRLLRQGGLASLDRPAASYGLPLALGAAEVTLLELTGLYAALAREGKPGQVRLLEGGAGPAGGPAGAGEAPWLSAEACRRVTGILTAVERPDLPGTWALTREVPEVAWKTGTSFAHRDAWAVGYTEGWTVGVWVGNFDGRPVEGISGSRDAAPLLFGLFRALDPGGRPRPEPAGTPRLPVCAESRQLPTPWCPRTLEVAYLPGRTRLPSCQAHRRVFVEAGSGRLLTGDCLARAAAEGRAREPRVVTLHPPELVAWWRSRGRPVPELPAPAPGCGGAAALGEGPRVVSPDGSTPYRLRPSAPTRFQRLALIARGRGELFWYQDGKLIASGPPEERRFVDLVPGRHRLVVVDGAGRVDRVEYRVLGEGAR